MPLKWDNPVDPRLDITLGYEYFMDKSHPLASKQGKVYYHRHVASMELGRWVTASEEVHHIDENRSNNKPSNLEVLTVQEHRHRHVDLLPLKPCAVCETLSKNVKYCSYACSQKASRKTERPSAEKLAKEIQESNWTALGRKYGVSCNAVRKWAKRYGLL